MMRLPKGLWVGHLGVPLPWVSRARACSCRSRRWEG